MSYNCFQVEIYSDEELAVQSYFYDKEKASFFVADYYYKNPFLNFYIQIINQNSQIVLTGDSFGYNWYI